MIKRVVSQFEVEIVHLGEVEKKTSLSKFFLEFLMEKS